MRHLGPEVVPTEGSQTQPELQLSQVLASRLRSSGVVGPEAGLEVELACHPGQQLSRRRDVVRQRIAREAHVAEMDREPEPVVSATTLADQGEILLVEGVVTNQVALFRGDGEQGAPLGRRQDRAPWHPLRLTAQVLIEGLAADADLAG